MALKYTLTADSVTVVHDNKPHTFTSGSTQYKAIRTAILGDDWASIPPLLKTDTSLRKYLGDKFTADGERIYLMGIEIPQSISARIWEMVRNAESPAPLFKFFEKLAQNTSYRSVTQLYGFLKHAGIPIEPDGTFLAYKGVRDDFYDQHSNKYLNVPGEIMKMPRNQISDDPTQHCHVGFHVGALGYAKTFGPKQVICRVDPMNVVCVPDDYNAQKMRVCEYQVIGHWNGQEMPSTTYKVDGAAGEVDPAWVDGADEDQDDETDEVGAVATPKVVKAIKVAKPSALAAKFNKMNVTQLMEESLDSLRKYAAHSLKIVGASKMPGGKTALVTAIMKLRKKG